MPGNAAGTVGGSGVSGQGNDGGDGTPYGTAPYGGAGGGGAGADAGSPHPRNSDYGPLSGMPGGKGGSGVVIIAYPF